MLIVPTKLPSSKLTVCYWKCPFIVDLPTRNGGSFHSYVNVYQRVLQVSWTPIVQNIFLRLVSEARRGWGGSSPALPERRANSQEKGKAEGGGNSRRFVRFPVGFPSSSWLYSGVVVTLVKPSDMEFNQIYILGL